MLRRRKAVLSKAWLLISNASSTSLSLDVMGLVQDMLLISRDALGMCLKGCPKPLPAQNEQQKVHPHEDRLTTTCLCFPCKCQTWAILRPKCFCTKFCCSPRVKIHPKKPQLM